MTISLQIIQKNNPDTPPSEQTMRSAVQSTPAWRSGTADGACSDTNMVDASDFIIDVTNNILYIASGQFNKK